jgi:hypothetical protein
MLAAEKYLKRYPATRNAPLIIPSHAPPPVVEGREPMGKVDVAKAGDFLFRYMFARYKCKHMAEPPRPAARLAV